MSEPERVSDIAQALIEPCNHERTEIRYKMFSNGTKHLCTQCLICGQMPGGTCWLSQDGIEINTIQPFDETIASRWLAQRNKALTAKLKNERLDRHLEYERYIQESDEWWAIRTKVMNRDKHLCQGCLEENATDVHHKNYLHLFKEILFDLVAVCRTCHDKIHSKF